MLGYGSVPTSSRILRQKASLIGADVQMSTMIQTYVSRGRFHHQSSQRRPTGYIAPNNMVDHDIFEDENLGASLTSEIFIRYRAACSGLESTGVGPDIEHSYGLVLLSIR